MTLSGQKIKVNNASRFGKPVHAVLDGSEPVRVTHVGDAEGMSPVYLCIDAQGKSEWRAQSDVRFTDPDFLPIGQESIEGLRSNTSSSAYPSAAGSRS